MGGEPEVSGTQAILQALSEVVGRVLAAPGAHGGLTDEHIDELAIRLAEYLETRFEGQFDPDECREMARFVIIQQQAQRHVAVAAVDVRAQDNPFSVNILMKAADNRAQDEWSRRKRGCRHNMSDWSSAKDDELVSAFFHEPDSHAVVAALKELHRRRMYRSQSIIATHLELGEELGREPHLRETAWRLGVSRETVKVALLRFKNLLVEISQ
jgi:hypothetical protein